MSTKKKVVVIQNIPNFTDSNANQQQRFITLIDILYEKKIFLMISMASKLEEIGYEDVNKNKLLRTL